MRNYAKKWVRNGRERALELYDWEKNVTQMEELYRSLSEN